MVKHPWPLLEISLSDFRIPTYLPTYLENNRSVVFKATTYLPVLHHKSATICQVDSYMVSNSKLKPGQCNCVKTEIIESMSP